MLNWYPYSLFLLCSFFSSSFPVGKQKYNQSFFILFSKKYEALPKSITKHRDQNEFKSELKLHLAPKRYTFLSRGDKVANRLLTRICVGRSYLNAHSFKYQLSESPLCPKCNLHSESTSHFVQIFLAHNEERRTMLVVFEHYIPKFNTFSKQKQLDIILNGYDKGNEEFFNTNISLQYALQNFIIKTKRFSSFT